MAEPNPQSEHDKINKNLISKEVMRGFLKHLSNEHTLVCPVDTGKVIEYREIKNSDDSAVEPAAEVITSGKVTSGENIAVDEQILTDDRISYNSFKTFYFPQTELMFTFKNEDIIDNTDIPGFVIFGARPCDLEALRVMNIVYTSGKYADPFFQRRFDANFLIGVGCKNKKSECFCDEMKINKDYSDFCDIMLTDNGENYTIVHLSEKGRNALKEYAETSEFAYTHVSEYVCKFTNEHDKNHTCENTCENNRKPADACEDNPENNQKPVTMNKDKLMLDVNKDDTDYFDIIDWAKVTATCKGCGICTYICPTCYCFDFKDVSKKGEAKRYKCWDSCMYPKFTLHASGHNPREKRYERYRQRVLHKYKYVPDNFSGAVACTGCGRCVRGCPVGINIKNIVKMINNS